MNISIAMTTYNGEKYIRKQLESIRKQTRKADEVIICDDCSTDNTVQIINSYIKMWELKEWKVYQSKSNNGWIYNYHKCIEKTSGDIVFFCDQDDIWDLNKIQIMDSVMRKSSDIWSLSCRVHLIDDKDNIIPNRNKNIPFGSRNSESIKRVKLDSKFTYNNAPGCTICVRRELINLLSTQRELYEKYVPHDALYWKSSIAFGHAYILDLPLINYRIHNENASAPILKTSLLIKNNNLRMQEARIMDEQLNQINRILLGLRELIKEPEQAILNRILKFSSCRLEFLQCKKNIVVYFVKNLRYYRCFKMFLGDSLSLLR